METHLGSGTQLNLKLMAWREPMQGARELPYGVHFVLSIPIMEEKSAQFIQVTVLKYKNSFKP